ncbi:TPA: hypothetical protein ACOEA5_001975 [Enterobacter kobei]
MKICFPARKANGEHYATTDDMMQPLCQEPHGSWLAGTNNMWHGGIHITHKSAPGSALTNETADTAVPLQFMAGGEVVAWRINQDYLTGKYINNPLQYSSTFVLVKSTCTPDPEKKDNSLDFYSLYIGLAPLSAFPEHKLYQVTDKGDGLSQREYTGKEKDGDKAPVAKNKLKAGDCVIVLREITFDLKGQKQTFGLARMLNSKSEITGGAFWVSLDPQYMTPAGKQRAYLPAWMQQAVAQGTFDTVVKPATKMEVAAGDAVGYLAEDIAPDSMGAVEKSAFAHIEVLSTDSRMVDFLRNKAQVKSGQKFVHIHPEGSVYARSGDTFTKTEGKVKKDIHKIMPQDKCHPFTDSNGKRWFDIGDGAWVSEDDVDADIGQYDLDKLGFKAFEEPSTSDMTKSLREGWIKDGFTRIAEWVRPERGIREKQVSDYYKSLLQKMDSDNSGDLSGEELRQAVNYAELDVRDIAARMVVRHDSEWFGGSNHHRWRIFLKQLDPLCISYVRQWFDNMEWMSKVDEFSSGAPVWHMHPVTFLHAISEANQHKRRDYNLGTLSSRYETGGRGSQTVSGGAGDAGGVSYGAYQMTSKTTRKIHGHLQSIVGGTVKVFISDSTFKWKSDFSGLTPGSSEFTSKWKELVKANPEEFKRIEHEFIRKTHFDKLVEHTLYETNVDIRYHSHALNDVLWSTAVQHGPSNNIIVNAIKTVDGDVSETKAYDQKLIGAIYDERGKKNDKGNLTYFSKNSKKVQDGVSDRFISEKKEALGRLKNESDY